MSIFPLDAVRNAAIDQDLELLLEDVREEVAGFPFSPGAHGEIGEILEAYDMSRPRLNVITSTLIDLHGTRGADIGTGLGFLPVILQRQGLHVVATERQPAVSAFASAHGI
jgi:protein-L-isoaspartate O-methyltransferase